MVHCVDIGIAFTVCIIKCTVALTFFQFLDDTDLG